MPQPLTICKQWEKHLCRSHLRHNCYLVTVFAVLLLVVGVLCYVNVFIICAFHLAMNKNRKLEQAFFRYLSNITEYFCCHTKCTCQICNIFVMCYVNWRRCWIWVRRRTTRTRMVWRHCTYVLPVIWQSPRHNDVLTCCSTTTQHSESWTLPAGQNCIRSGLLRRFIFDTIFSCESFDP